MEFFNSAVGVLQTLVVALGAGLGIWGVINLLEGYGQDNPVSKSQGMKQLMASGGEESAESVIEQETVGDVSDLLSALAGSQVIVSVTEDGIQFSSGENDSGQTGTVTTGGGNLNVRMGAGMDYTAFTQLPSGTTVKVIGTDGDWLKVILSEKVGYVYSGYMTVSDGEAGSGEGSSLWMRKRCKICWVCWAVV